MIPRLFILSAVAFSIVVAQDNSDLIAKLLEAPTDVARINLLPDDAFKFDFTNPAAREAIGAGGFASSANAVTMPATIGNDASITVGFIGPCGMNTPHTHPRSSEFNYVTNGSLIMGMIPENGAQFVFNEVGANQATLFPQGAIHFEYNEHCEPVTFVAFFRDSFPGVSQVAQRFFGLPADVVAAALATDPSEVEKISELIPDSVSLALEECTKRCGIDRAGQPTEQLQKNVPDSNSSNNTSSNPGVTGNLDLSEGENGQNKGLIIGLVAAVAVMALGYIALAALALFRRRRGAKAGTRGYVQTGESFAPGGMYDSEKYELHSDRLRTPYDPPSGSH